MIQYNRFCLDNGLRVLIHEDPSTPMAAVNLAYDVGARDESPQKTGFAHLFEHLMFSGSRNVPEFDYPIQLAGGESNAFTNNDYTNYYETLPANNLETALWLESDRMMALNINERSLEVQKRVVCEEFKEHYINQPYGDVWHKLRALSYQKHPYRWPTIGKELAHIENAELADVQGFFDQHYLPNRAILVISGGIKTTRVEPLIRKWFEEIPAAYSYKRNLPIEDPQTADRKMIMRAKVPANAIYMAFQSTDRYSPHYYTTDLITDILAVGESSRMKRILVKEKQLFSEIDAYITGDIHTGLLIITGKLMPDTKMEVAEAAIWSILEDMASQKVPDQEMQKVKNKMEAHIGFSETNIMNNAMNLAFYELLGDAQEINLEVPKYLQIEAEDVRKVSEQIFRREACTTIYYLKQVPLS